jgi:SH3 domain protein
MIRIANAARRSAAAILVLAAAAGSAETTWVADDLAIIPMHTGPSTEYKLKAWLETSASATVLDRRGDWVHVRTQDDKEGWIDSKYLSSQPSAAARLAKTQADSEQARSQFGTLTERVKQLEGENAKLVETESAQKEELETIKVDNMELRAGARWPHWITGASLLAVGMLMGAIVQSMNGRRARPRIRL